MKDNKNCLSFIVKNRCKDHFFKWSVMICGIAIMIKLWELRFVAEMAERCETMSQDCIGVSVWQIMFASFSHCHVSINHK